MKQLNAPVLKGVLFYDNKVRLRIVYSNEAWPLDWWFSREQWEEFKARVDNAFTPFVGGTVSTYFNTERPDDE